MVCGTSRNVCPSSVLQRTPAEEITFETLKNAIGTSTSMNESAEMLPGCSKNNIQAGTMIDDLISPKSIICSSTAAPKNYILRVIRAVVIHALAASSLLIY